MDVDDFDTFSSMITPPQINDQRRANKTQKRWGRRGGVGPWILMLFSLDIETQGLTLGTEARNGSYSVLDGDLNLLDAEAYLGKLNEQK